MTEAIISTISDDATSAPKPALSALAQQLAVVADQLRNPALALRRLVPVPEHVPIVVPPPAPSAAPQVGGLHQALAAAYVPPVALGMLDRLRAAQHQGPPQPTGVAPIDRALRGGLRLEKVLVLGGAPGAGKTSLARQIADNLARSGVAVGWLASDEEPSAIDVRRLQAIGVPRALAEQPDEATIERAARELAPLPFEVFDETFTIEAVFAELARRYPNAPRCVIGDSLQTVRTARSATFDSQRARIDDVLVTAKACARAPATRASLIFTSELARGSYRSEASADAVSDLAAFKESGGIEYGAHTLIVLRTPKGESDLVDATMPKNRCGPKVDFQLRLDRETTELVEVEAGRSTATFRDKIGIAATSVLEWLHANRPDGTAVRWSTVWTEIPLRRSDLDAAKDRLLHARQIEAHGSPLMVSVARNAPAFDPGAFAPPPLLSASESYDEVGAAVRGTRDA